MSRLILKSTKPKPTLPPAIPPEVEAVLLRVLAQEIREAINLPPAPAARPVATATPPAWAVRLQQQIQATGKRLDELSALQAATTAHRRQPLIDYILVNSDLYTAEELEKLSPGELERIARLVDQAVGPKGRRNMLDAQGLIALPQSILNANEWEPYQAPERK